MDWWKTLAGSRDGCFSEALLKVDATIVCHQIRCPDLEKGERLWFSVKDLRCRERENLVDCGEAVPMKSLQLDTLLLVRTWAGRDRAERVFGELRIPLDWLIHKCNSCLYYTWVQLDTPGLDASVSSVGMLAAQDDGNAFDQALRNGPRVLTSPGVCMSIIKTSELGPSGQIMFTDDMSLDAKFGFWPCLLRSQQQHMMMCQAQKFQRPDRTSVSSEQGDAKRLQDQLRGLQDQLRDTTSGFEAERAKFEDERDRLSDSQSNPEVTKLRERVVEMEANERYLQSLVEEMQNGNRDEGKQRVTEMNRLAAENKRLLEREATLQAANDRQKGELKENEALRVKLDEISDEANRKITGANDLIRRVKRERDDIKEEIQLLRSDQDGQNHQQNEGLVSELKAVEERGIKQVMEIDQLRGQVSELEAKAQMAVTDQMMNSCQVDDKVRELVSLRQANAQLEAELAGLRGALDSVCNQGKEHMGSITEQVRALGEEREAALQEREAFREKFKKVWVENQQLQDNLVGLEEEHASLIEQRDTLMKIVEDLHQACESADVPDLQEMGRASMRGIATLQASIKAITPRNAGNTPRKIPMMDFSNLNMTSTCREPEGLA